MSSKDLLKELEACFTREEMESVLKSYKQLITDAADRGDVNFFLRIGKAIEEIGA